MDIAEPTFVVRPAGRSYHFLASASLIVIDVAAVAALLVRRLNSMPFPAVTALVAAMFVLVWCLRLALSNHERLRAFVQNQEGSAPNSTAVAMLRAWASLIHGGLFLTGLAAGLLLLALLQMSKT